MPCVLVVLAVPVLAEELVVRPFVPAAGALPGGRVVVIALATVLVVRVLGAAVLVSTELVVNVIAAGVLTGGAAVVTTVPVAVPPPDEPPASSTSATASPAIESSATTTMPTTSGRQRGAGASRVRAAVPQRRHQSWSSRRGAPHIGQCSSALPAPSGGVGVPPASALTPWSSLPAAPDA